MKTSFQKLLVILVISGLFLSACGSVKAPTPGADKPTPLPPVTTNGAVVAEGRVVPRKDVDLSFATAGKVAEVLVEEGAQVKVGDVLARLDNREEIEASVAKAQQELVNAQQALDNLDKDLAVSRENALLSVSKANKDLKEAKYNLFNFTIPSTIEKMDVFKAIDVTSAKLDAAREAYEPYKNKDDDERVTYRGRNITIVGDPHVKELKDAMDRAQSDYYSAVRWLELQMEVSRAQAQLDQAMKDYKELQQGPKADNLAAAKARLAAAKASVESAEAARDNLDLKATINGTIVEQNLTVGQQVSPSQIAMKLADFSQLFVETDNLTEIQVVDIAPKQNVKVVADALPDVKMSGTVDNIKQVYEEKRGDVTYTVRILLTDVDPRLRWGMTVVTTFEK